MRKMTDIRIPTRLDLMYPTLVAVRDLGGSATRSELLEKVPEVAGVTDEQLAVVFPEDSRRAGKSKVLYKIPWACTYLKRIDALENSRGGVWSITPKGLHYLDVDGGEEALKSASKAYVVGKEESPSRAPVRPGGTERRSHRGR